MPRKVNVSTSDLFDFFDHVEKQFEGIEYDGRQIWWFYKLRFYGDTLLKPLPSHKQVMKRIQTGTALTLRDKIRSGLITFAIRKGLFINEGLKMLIAGSLDSKKNRGVMDRIMFLSHTNCVLPDPVHGYTADRIGTVVSEIRADPDMEEYISIVAPLSHKACLGLRSYENLVYPYADREMKRNARKNASRLHHQYKDACMNLKPDSTREQEIFSHYKPALDVFFSREILYLTILYYEIYKRILREKDIKLMCYDAGTGIISRCAIAAAHKSGIKSIHICHGLGAPHIPLDKPDSVHVAVIGQKYKDEYIKVGVKPGNVHVTGPVFMDEIVPYAEKDYPKNDPKKILLAATPWLEDNEGILETYTDYITKLLRELNNTGNVEISIKMHLRETNREIYQSIIKAGSYDNIELIGPGDQTKGTLYSLITESDIVLSFASTVGIEAMAIGRPSPTIDLLDREYTDPILNERTNILHISPKEDLTETVRDILFDVETRKKLLDKQEKAIREYLYKVDGKGGERVHGIIKKLIAE